MEAAERLISHGEIHPCLFIDYALFMGKSEKTVLPVIGAHSAFSDTAEGHGGGGEVDDRVVNAAPSKPAAFHLKRSYR